MKSFQDDIKAYLDGELSLTERDAFEAAMSSDAQLQDEVNFMKELTGSIQQLGADEIRIPGDPGAIIDQIKTPRRSVLRWPLALGLAGTFLVMLFGVVSLGQLRNRDRGPMMDVAAGAAPSSKAPLTESPEDGMASESREVPVRRRQYSNAIEGRRGEMDKAAAPEASSAVPPEGLTAKLIRTASLQLVVPSVTQGLREAAQIAEGMGGFVTDSTTSDAQNVLASGSAILRVPVKQFNFALSRLREIGEVSSESSNTEDVTTQVADVQARLKVMRAEEESYITMLRAARRVGELLEIRERLSTVRQEIESLDAQRRALADQTTFSTISVQMQQRVKVGEPKPRAGWSEDAWSNAVNGLQAAGRGVGQAAIFGFVYAPLWLPIILIGAYLLRRRK